MNLVKDFVWFTTHSWSYMQGMRREYFSGFWKAWLRFRASSKADRTNGTTVGA